MPNPVCLPCDTDVLIQVFLGKAVEVLHTLRIAFDIQPVITEEVELELRGNRPHAKTYESQLTKAITTGALALADPEFVSRAVGAPSRQVGQGFFDQFQTTGDRYRKHVGKGEAYTHALGITLGVPVASNDRRAITVLTGLAMSLPAPVLRFFDLLVFAHQEGRLDLQACDEIRSNLRAAGEGLDACFQHASFSKGLATFVPRLVVADMPLVGDSGAPGATGVEARLFISRPH